MYDLQTVILNISEPIVIKNHLKWDMLTWNLEKWTEMLGGEVLNFRLGANEFTEKPQYENTTKAVQITFKEFLERQQINLYNWLYFDYKYLKDWFKNKHDLRKQIDWADFGFPNLNADDSTIWIGSKGAHTPCHADTYGCNIVAQIYGRKKWILFPPNENLLPSRVPYEESSIYSQLNFFTPSINKFKGSITKTVNLEPGDVLILPHKWWHYVESLDMAISINTWIPLPIDPEERVKESIVQTLIFQLTNDLNQELRKKVLNPEQQEMSKCNLMESIGIIKASVLELRNEATNEGFPVQINIKDVLEQFAHVHQINELTKKEFEELLYLQQQQRFESNGLYYSESEEEKDIVKVINSMLHPDVIELIKYKMLNN